MQRTRKDRKHIGRANNSIVLSIECAIDLVERRLQQNNSSTRIVLGFFLSLLIFAPLVCT